MDRTALWVQKHSSSSIRQYQAERNALANAHPHLKVHRPEGTSSQQSSRTDLGGQDRGIGSGGRTFARSPTAVANIVVAGGANGSPSRYRRHETVRYVDEPLSDSQHQRGRSSSQTRVTPMPHDHRALPRLNIESTMYRNPNLPAFVQGPPGSGYPMSMSSAPKVPPPIRATVPDPPSSPLEVPSPLNPKVRPRSSKE